MRLLFFLFCLSCVFPAMSQDSSKIFMARRISQVIRIDGKLDEEAWKQATPYSDFVQNQPVQGGKPGQKTEVRIMYDNFALYVGAIMYDTAPDSILKELGSRDDGNINADFFRIVFDPYNTRQDAFDFSVSASGVQLDSKFSDPTFDAVWFSQVRITEQGWIAEMKIPYYAIRFPRELVQNWGLQITRTIRRTREFDQWALTRPGKSA
jgi:hypothetical protein